MEIKKPKLSFKYPLTPLNMNEVDTIVLHNTGASNSNVNSIHMYHKSLGWSGIGYNYLIDKEGNIYECRGLNVGAQTKGHNSRTIGISAVGNYNTESMPKVQKEAIIWLCKHLMEENPKIKHIKGHRDLNNTDCPGLNFPLDEIKKLKLSDSKPNKKRYIEEFQEFYNKTTQTGSPLKVDGVYGEKSKEAWNLLKRIYKGELDVG